LAIIFGLFSLVVFVIVIHYNYTTKEIRMTGQLVRTHVVSLNRSRSGGSCNVIIDGKELRAGMSYGLNIGDIIAVRYIKGESRVVQERVEVWRIYLWLGLSSILLVVGIFLIVGGFTGKQ